MEKTPPPSRALRQRHTPTPKMSERKRSLFASSSRHVASSCPTTIDEDSDLGPMSPLQFSCSPSSYDASHTTPARFMKNRESRTDFKNVMLTLSPLNNNNQQSIRSTPTKTGGGGTPVKPAGPTSSTSVYERIPDSPSAVDSRSSDMFPLEKENRIESAQKTPSTVDVPPPSDLPRVTFRKSLIFDTGMTPDESYLDEKLKKKRSPDDPLSSGQDMPKARTCLSFDDKPQISAKTFYGSSFSESTSVKRREPIVPAIRPIPSTSHQAQRKRRSVSKKSVANIRPTLGGINRGVRHKIVKPKFQSTGRAQSTNALKVK